MHPKNQRIFSLAAISALALSACSHGSKRNETTVSTPPAQASLQTQAPATAAQTAASNQAVSDSIVDEMALNEIHHINQKEIALSQMALKQAQSNSVKQQAQLLIDDHQALENQVKSSADQLKFSLAKYTPSTAESQVSSRLGSLKDAQFDQAFITQMMIDHQQAVNELRLLRRSSKNAQVTQLIDRALPHLQQHQASTRRVADNLGISIGPFSGYAE